MGIIFLLVTIFVCFFVWLLWFLGRNEISERDKIILLCWCKNYLSMAYPKCHHDKSLTVYNCEYVEPCVVAITLNIYGSDDVRHQVYMKLKIINLEEKNISVLDIDDAAIAKYRSDFNLDC